MLALPSRLLQRLPGTLQAGCLVLSLALALVAARWGEAWVVGLAVPLLAWLAASLWQRQARSTAALADQLRALRAGDLVRDADAGGVGVGSLAIAAAEAQLLSQQFSQVVARIRSEAQLIAMSAENSARGAQALSQRTESQAAGLEQARAGIDGLLETMHADARLVQAAGERAAQVQAEAMAAQAEVQRSVDGMSRIAQRSRQMDEIIGAIDGIAFRTNILALNAAVEAARAGEAGRGFAVVASEVRMLAQRSAEAAAEVKRLIGSSGAEVAAGLASIEASRRSLDRAAAGVCEVATELRDVVASGELQRLRLQEISQAVATLDDITQRNAQMVEGTVDAAGRLHQRAADLDGAVAGMRLRQGCADEARALAEKAARFVDSAGPQEAVRQFHDPNGPFRDRDLYIVVADRDDYFRAFGSDPQKAGKLRSQALPGDDQAAIRDASWAAVERGGGWIEFSAPHPVTRQPVAKIGYIVPALGGRWAVQCSVNRGDGRG
jgi:methyl-accepting chemotaxis protein